MKRIVLVVALATLAACQQEEAAPAPEPSAEVAATPTAATGSLAADGKSPVGSYEITTSDGQVFREEVRADGTYTDTDKDGKVVESGKWQQKSPSQFCSTSDEAGATERCNTEAIDAAGVWTSTNADGKTATVKRVGG